MKVVNTTTRQSDIVSIVCQGNSVLVITVMDICFLKKPNLTQDVI